MSMETECFSFQKSFESHAELKTSSIFINKDMYELPGNPEMTENDVRRYEKGNREIEKHRVDSIRAWLSSEDTYLWRTAIDLLPSVSEVVQQELRTVFFETIRHVLENKDLVACREWLSFIKE